MSNEVYQTETFTKLYESLSEREKLWIDKMILQLKSNSSAGKPLKFEWFREKKFEDKRLYYLTYKNSSKVLLVAFGKKKEQQKIINHILSNLNFYNKLVGEV